MAYVAPTIQPSGITFSQWQKSGVSGHLELLLAAQTPTLAPTVAPTVAVGGSGGTLPAGTYYVVNTEGNGLGETTPGPVSAQFTVAAGQEPVISYPGLQTHNAYRNLYIGAVNGPSTGPFTLIADGVTAATTTITAPAAGSYAATTPPTANSTGLTFADASGNVVNKPLSLLRALKDGNSQTIYQYFRGLVTEFNQGEPVAFGTTLTKFHHFHTVVAILNTLANEAGVLLDANPGTLASQPTGIGQQAARRTWP